MSSKRLAEFSPNNTTTLAISESHRVPAPSGSVIDVSLKSSNLRPVSSSTSAFERKGQPSSAWRGWIQTDQTTNPIKARLPILPVLQSTLDAGPCGDLTFIVGANGRPFTKESFGNEFKAACKAAGVPGSAHGVRKIAATRAADAGATEAELMAIFGWTDPKMAAHYTRTANRKRLTAQAMTKLATSIPAPSDPVRESERKAK